MIKIDRGFIERLIRGDEESYNNLQGFAMSYISNFVPDLDDVKDIVAEARKSVVANIGKADFTGGRGSYESNFKKWFRTILYRKYLDFREKRKREITIGELSRALALGDDDKDLINSDFGTLDGILSCNVYQDRYADDTLWGLAVKEVASVVMSMKDGRKRVAVILKFVYQFTIEEVAEIMRLSKSTVNNIIYRARKELVRLFEEKGIDAGYLDRNDWRRRKVRRIRKR
jgi:RNA polymerase sigma factor (sigma-70 family)